MLKKIKLGLIGPGRIGRIHLQHLANSIPEAEVCWVAGPVKATTKAAAAYNIVRAGTDALVLIRNTDVDAVVICSPTDTHLAYIEAAALSGKHIFCEKPLAMHADEIVRIMETTEKHQVQLQVGFNRRFDKNFKRVHDMVQAGKTGVPHILRITSRDPAPPPVSYIKTSGGLFMDMSIHDFDMARFIVGDEVREVYAIGDVLVDKRIGEAGDIDTAVITLKFKKGCIGVIDNSRKAVYGYDQRLELFGSEGMSMADNNYPDAQILYNEKGRHVAAPLYFFMDRYMQAYCDEMQAFVDALLAQKTVPVGCLDALRATEIAVAARQSLESGKPVCLS